MTKQEWKEQYGAARMLINARFGQFCRTIKSVNINKFTEQPASKIDWEIACNHIDDNMHPSIADAVFHGNEVTYNLLANKWAIKQNSTVFNRKMPIRASKMKWRNV
jgi:hypothetical protein